MAKLFKKTIGYLDLKINDMPVKWGFRRLGTREFITFKEALRPWYAFKAKMIVLNSEREALSSTFDPGNDDSREKMIGVWERTLNDTYTTEHLDAVTEWVLKLTTEVKGLKDEDGEEILWSALDAEERAEICDLFSIFDLSNMLDLIMTNSSLGEIVEKKLEPGSQAQESAPDQAATDAPKPQT